MFAVYLVILAAYVGLLFLGPDISTREGIVVMAVGQKIAIYSGMVCWFAQFLGAREYHRRHSMHSRGQAQDEIAWRVRFARYETANVVR